MASTNTKAAAEVQEKKFDWHQIKSLLPIISFVAIVAIFAILTRGQLITPRNITLIISGGFTLMIATVGVYMIMSMGCLDFSQGSMMGLSCAVVCYLSQFNPFVAILGGMATGALIGLINAVFHVKGQIQSFVVTMCMMFLLRGIIAYITTSSPVMASTTLTSLATNTPLLVGIVVVVLVIAYARLQPQGDRRLRERRPLRRHQRPAHQDHHLRGRRRHHRLRRADQRHPRWLGHLVLRQHARDPDPDRPGPRWHAHQRRRSLPLL